jgi:hypothetical protein
VPTVGQQRCQDCRRKECACVNEDCRLNIVAFAAEFVAANFRGDAIGLCTLEETHHMAVLQGVHLRPVRGVGIEWITNLRKHPLQGSLEGFDKL